MVRRMISIGSILRFTIRFRERLLDIIAKLPSCLLFNLNRVSMATVQFFSGFRSPPGNGSGQVSSAILHDSEDWRGLILLSDAESIGRYAR
jgi:hypothetical protein